MTDLSEQLREHHQAAMRREGGVAAPLVDGGAAGASSAAADEAEALLNLIERLDVEASRQGLAQADGAFSFY